jgi:AcrR family transcriptional regulator
MTKRGPYRKGEAKRTEILRVALEVFAEEGYRGTSLRKVAARCELSLPGLMHYFESKEDLLTEILRMRDITAKERLKDLEDWEAVNEVIAEGGRTPGLVELFISLAASAGDDTHPAHAFFARRYEELRAEVTRMIQNGIDRGHLRAELPADRVAVLMISLADGVQLQWLADRSVDMTATMADAYTLLLFKSEP